MQVVELVRALVALQMPEPAAAARRHVLCLDPAAGAVQPGQQQGPAVGAPAVQQPAEPAAAAGGTKHIITAEAEEVRRLVRERAGLVATGIYGRGDALIRQLDARIGCLIAEQGHWLRDCRAGPPDSVNVVKHLDRQGRMPSCGSWTPASGAWLRSRALGRCETG